MNQNTFEMIAKTFSGMEDVLMYELENLGATNCTKLTRAVSFTGDKALMYKANLWCRTALRILVPFKSFEVSNEQSLYDEIQKIDWSVWLTTESTLAIETTLNQTVFNHSQFVSQKIKDAIVDQFRARFDKRPSVDLRQPDLRIQAHIYDNKCTLSFDSSGESLHKRGYRDLTNEAPINEALAAGIIKLTGWKGDSPFVDFMCGSGTFLIEAAMIARNMAPNKFRKQFGFQRMPDYDEELWQNIYDDALIGEKESIDFEISGGDKNGMVLQKAQQNINNAGLQHDIKLTKTRFENFMPPEDAGIVITNPPYGLRLQENDLMQMYQEIGNTLKQQYAGWQAWVFTGNLNLFKFIGLRPTRKIHLYNGAVECRLLRFDMYSGTKRIHKFRNDIA
ncbi:MAG: class I SAM-dependent RNA methyltransferase [Bacteroidia bacterium]|nr:class I SAM-dependent RNA methyltransferase [Bacteroidia bacterium]HQV00692.1 THUMP domain-containing protein [Bacteroidia bacterium]